MPSDELSRPIRPVPTSYVSAPGLWLDWACQWIAYWAGSLAVFRVLDYAGKLGILVALIFWVADYPERQRTAIRTAWAVVNEKGGGRKENLEYLAGHDVDLKGLNGASGYFAGIVLTNRDLSWSDLDNANFEDAKLDEAKLKGAMLSGTNFKHASLSHAHFRYSRLYPSAPNLDGADIDGADFRDITISNVGVYRTFAAARNWQTALFDKTTRRMVECTANASTALSGCTPNVPDIQENPRALDPNRLVEAIVASVHCEIRNAVVFVINADKANYQYNQELTADWLNKWGAQIQISLTSNEQGPLSPSSALFGGANTSSDANISSDATRTDILNYYYKVKDLYGTGRGCTPAVLSDIQNHPAGSLLIQSDLKLREWLSGVVLGDPSSISRNSKNAIAHDVKFQVVTNGNITRTWKLAPATNNPTTPFAAASRIRTHELLIILGPNDPTTNSLGPNSPASGTLLSQQIGSGIGNALAPAMPPTPSGF
jgi:uncharacterized protein YjbI with pentapeptide repeats